MKIRLQIVVMAAGLSLLTGCSSAPFVSPASGVPSSTNIPSAPAVSSAKEKLATQSATPSASGSSATTPGSVERSAVVWADYDTGLQNTIDQATGAGDCRGISTFFGMTTATEDSVLARTGHGNEAVVTYLNEALVIANCS